MDMAYQIASSMWVYADDNNFVDMFNRINKSYNGNAKCFLEKGRVTKLDKEIKGYTTQKGTNIYYNRDTTLEAIYVSKQVKSSYSTLSGDLKKAGECKAIIQNLTMYYQIALKDKANENKYFWKSATMGKQLNKKYPKHSQQRATYFKHIDNYTIFLTKVYQERSTLPLSWAPWLKNEYEQKGCTIYGNIR